MDFSKRTSKFVKDSAWTFISLLIVGFSGLLLQTLINRSFSSESLGIYLQIVSYYTLFSALSSMGLETSIVKLVSENQGSIFACKQILSAAILLVIASSLVIFLFLFLLDAFDVLIFSSETIRDEFGYIAVAIPLFAINKMFIATLNAFRLMKCYSTIRLIRWILVFLISSAFIWFNKDLRYCLLAYVYTELILFIYFVLVRFRGWICFMDMSLWVRKHLCYGVYGLFMSVIGEVNTNMLVIISGYFLSLSEVALVGFVMSFTKAITMALTSIQINYNPMFVNCSKLNNRHEIELNISKIYKVTILTSIPLLIISVLSYHIYVTCFMGADFTDSVKYFLLVSFGAVLCYIFQWNSSMLLLSGRFKGEITRVISVVIIKLIVTYLLTRYYGLVGNLSAYMLVELYSVGINIYMINKLLGYNLLKLACLWK